MEEQQAVIPSSSEHSHTGLYTTIALSLGAAALLLVIVLAMLIKKPTTPSLPTQTYQITQQDLRTQPSSIQNEVQQVTPTPVQSKQDLQTLAQQLDTANMAQVTTSLDQNSQDTSSFSQ